MARLYPALAHGESAARYDHGHLQEGNAFQSGALIHIENLRRHFLMGDQVVRALDGLDVNIEVGEFVAIMGPSGSGKSTLLYLLGGLDRPSEGRIWVNGYDICALDENTLARYRRREIGFIFQSFHLIPTMTALQNVAFPMVFSGVSARERDARANDLLVRVGLADRIHHRPTELSGGQQQRIAVARALVNDPSIILADEPTGNLDSQTGREIMELLAQLNREEGRTILVVSHDPAVTDYATRAIHLLDGRLLVPYDHESGVGHHEEAHLDQSLPSRHDGAGRPFGAVRLRSRG